MKSVMLMCLLTSAAIVCARDCIYDGNGICIKPCPEGTILFTSGCALQQGIFTSPTCSEPVPRDVSNICDMSWCGCANRNLFWDDLQKKCVKLEDCARATITQRSTYNYENKA